MRVYFIEPKRNLLISLTRIYLVLHQFPTCSNIYLSLVRWMSEKLLSTTYKMTLKTAVTWLYKPTVGDKQ